MVVLSKEFPGELGFARRIGDGIGEIGEIGCGRVKGSEGKFRVADEAEVRFENANNAIIMQASLLIVY